MTSPELLKRNLKILQMYDSGDYSRKEIKVKLKLTSTWIIHYVVHNRWLYERDHRAKRFMENGNAANQV